MKVHHVDGDRRVTMNSKQVRVWKEVVWTYLKILTLHSSGNRLKPPVRIIGIQHLASSKRRLSVSYKVKIPNGPCA
jgi:hypothetical protein